MCRYNATHKANNERQDRLRRFLVEDSTVAASLKTHGVDGQQADLADVLDVVIRELGMPRSLKAVGVGSDQLDALAANSLHDRWCQSNPVPLKQKEQVLDILKLVVE